jgi:hypothetical protein
MKARWWLTALLSICIPATPLLARLAEAAVCDLTTAGSACSVQPGVDLFLQADPQPTGTGVIDSFVRIQDRGTEHGYNTDGRPVPFDEKTDPNFTRSLLLSEVPIVTISGVQYREFGLDINEQSSGSNRFLSLDELKIFLSPSGNMTTTDVDAPTPLGTLIYDLDATGDHWIKLDYSLGSGSGSGDMFAYINSALFTGPNQNVTLYSQFGVNFASGAGFEEWWVREGQAGGQPPIPEPTTLLLVGSGLAGLAAGRGRRRSRPTDEAVPSGCEGVCDT